MTTDQNQPRSKSVREPFLGLLIVVAIIGGLVVDTTRADGDAFYSDILRLDNVTTKIHQNYVEEIDSKKLVDNAIGGMLKTLDPHTTYFEKKQYEELMIHTEGKFGGLGIQISSRDNFIVVMTPISGTPASRAGIQSGDKIVKINGKTTRGLSLDQAVGKLRGVPGTDVMVTIVREGDAAPIEYTLTREIINIKSVPYCGVIDDSIGYFRLTQFSQESGAEVEKAINELLKKNVKAVIFDLRYNPGGLLQQAIEVSAKFLPRRSLVVSTRGRMRDQNKEFSSLSSPVLPDRIPLVVLVNEGSASASEIVSGAIQDWDRGVVLGDTTFGKGSVQSVLPLDSTHHIKLTTAFYYTPSGRCINKPENAIGARAPTDQGASDAPSDTSAVSDSSDSAEKPVTAKAVKDTTVYKTKSGRIVYGGGGIIPDTVVQPATLPTVVQMMLYKDAFFRFAIKEYPTLKQRNIKVTKDFVVDSRIMKDFNVYLDSVKFKYQTYAQNLFSDFQKKAGLSEPIVKDTANLASEKVYQTIKKSRDSLATKLYGSNETAPKENNSESSESTLGRPKWTKEEAETLKKLSGTIESILSKENSREFSENEKEITRFVREAFLMREFGQDNEIIFKGNLKEDTQVKAAIAVLNNKKLYDRLLAGSNR